jgi:rhamnosyltransferase subunit B
VKHLVLTTFGSLGDLHPFLAVALEWQARGGRATLATSERYRSKVEGEGVGFRAVRPDLPAPEESGALVERLMDLRSGTQRLFREVMMPSVRDSYADLREACRDADLLLSHPITFAAPLVAQQTGLPWASSVLAPVSLWSHHDPPLLPGVPGADLARRHPVLSRAFQCLARAGTRPWFRPVDELRRELGLGRGGHPLFEGQHSPQLLLALFSSHLAVPQGDWPRQAHACGFCFYDRLAGSASGEGDGLEPGLERFLRAGEAPVVWTLGSTAVYTARDFFARAQEASRALGLRAVYLIGSGQRWEHHPPVEGREAVAAYAPYSALFPRAGAVVHQGGVGTTGQALRAGAPQLVVPFSHDQPDNADRLRRLGVARALPRALFSSEEASTALRALLANSNYAQRAQKVAQAMRQENGPATACDHLETLKQEFKSHKPTQ